MGMTAMAECDECESTRGRGRDVGFTLVEFAVVRAIAGRLTFVAAPAARNRRVQGHHTWTKPAIGLMGDETAGHFHEGAATLMLGSTTLPRRAVNRAGAYALTLNLTTGTSSPTSNASGNLGDEEAMVRRADRPHGLRQGLPLLRHTRHGDWNMLTQRVATLRGEMRSDDAGFSLIEVVVALVVLMMFAGVLSVTLINGIGVSKVSRQRVAAANLAARELEMVRNKFSSSDANALAIAGTSSVVNGNPLGSPGDSVVDGIPYTVRRDVQWLPTGTGVSACDGGSLVNSPSLQVFVTVTWPNMRTAKPVLAETVMTPLKGQTDNLSVSYIALKVQNAAGRASQSVTATTVGPGGTFVHTTDASGCAVFQVGMAGTYSVTLNMAGWVDQTGTQLSVKTPITASLGTLVTKTMTYDLMASMNVTLATLAQYGLPSPLPAINYIKLDALLSSVRASVNPSSTTTLISGLWPTTGGFAAWPGGCPDSDPATAPTVGGSRGVPVPIPPGSVGSVTAWLAPVRITAKTSTGATLPGLVITATSASSPACATSDQLLTLGTTLPDGTLQTSLPYGNWTLKTKYTLSPLGPGPTNAIPDDLTPLGSGVTNETFQVN